MANIRKGSFTNKPRSDDNNQECVSIVTQVNSIHTNQSICDILNKSCILSILPETPYIKYWQLQKNILNRKLQYTYPDALILVEHPHTFTIGRNGHRGHVFLSDQTLESMGIPIYQVDRGGQATYHGPGQIVSYPIIDITNVGGAGRYVNALEDVIIQVMSDFSLNAHRNPNQRGIWIGDNKIGSIGIKITKRITTHGFSINVNNDLSYFDNIIPCGEKDTKLTSMERMMGTTINIKDVYSRIAYQFGQIFGMHIEIPTQPDAHQW